MELFGQFRQGGGRGPNPGDIQGQVSWGSEQPDLVGNVSIYCREVCQDDTQWALPTQCVLGLWHYFNVILFLNRLGGQTITAPLYRACNIKDFPVLSSFKTKNYFFLIKLKPRTKIW